MNSVFDEFENVIRKKPNQSVKSFLRLQLENQESYFFVKNNKFAEFFWIKNKKDWI
ncbi:plasmid partition family protein [Borreliella garinii]|uniref:plasmid partition family protein n=1 Tax=Borreliella garinii TaxID=29519 RepID=UPI0031389617